MCEQWISVMNYASYKIAFRKQQLCVVFGCLLTSVMAKLPKIPQLPKTHCMKTSPIVCVLLLPAIPTLHQRTQGDVSLRVLQRQIF